MQPSFQPFINANEGSQFETNLNDCDKISSSVHHFFMIVKLFHFFRQHFFIYIHIILSYILSNVFFLFQILLI